MTKLKQILKENKKEIIIYLVMVLLGALSFVLMRNFC